jgi:glucose/arabinose dehydrogenase
MKINFLFLVIVLCTFLIVWDAASQNLPRGFALVEVAQLSSNDVGFAFLPNDKRILVINKGGVVRLVLNGQYIFSPRLLTLPDIFFPRESGLVGIAADPDFPAEPYVYLFYTSTDSVSRVSRFTISGALEDPDSDSLFIDIASQYNLLEIPFTREIHKAGTLRFGADKTLFISYGDDTQKELVQDLTTLNGKIIRLNRDGSIPTDNPIFPDGPQNVRREIFAFGLRNPFRFSIDPVTEGLFIGDVGEASREELNLCTGGENFGWPVFQGNLDWDNDTLIPPEPTFPIHDYIHLADDRGYSVIAIAAYRQVDFPNDYSFPDEYNGAYFFADLFDGVIRYLSFENNQWLDREFASGFNIIVDGAVGSDGALYILEMSNSLKKIVFDGVTSTESTNPLPKAGSLSQNYPNPFNPSTTLKYALAQTAFIDLGVFNLKGQRIVTLVNQQQIPGSHFGVWNGRDERGQSVASGIYVYQLRADGRLIDTKKMIFIK